MKIILLILLTNLSGLYMNAQKVIINWGPESKKELTFGSFVNGKGSDMIKLCFEEKGGGMFGGKATSTPVLTRYNSKLDEVTEQMIEADDKGIQFNSLMSIKGKLFMFTSQYNRDDKTTSYYGQPLNIETLRSDGKLINLGEYEAFKRSSQTEVGFELSKDSSKILMFGNAPYKKNEKEKFYISVLDNGMNKLWSSTIELPYKDRFVSIEDQIITNEGLVGVLIKHYDQEVSKEAVRIDGNKVPSYKTKLLLYDKANGAPIEYILDIKDRFVHTLQLTDDNANNLVLFGLYKDKYNGYISGFFTATFDKSTKTGVTKDINAFPTELVEQIKIDRQGSDKEKDPGLSTKFRLADVLERSNGSKDYVLEYSSAVYVSNTNYGGGTGISVTYSNSSYWLYNYGDVIDINVQTNGKVTISRIPKMQTSKNVRIYSNFKALTYKDKLLVFYNDDDDNIDRDIEKRPDPLYKFNKSVFVMGVIDAKGNVSREILFRNRDNKITTAVRECTSIDKNRIGLYAQKVSGIFFASAKDKVGILEVR